LLVLGAESPAHLKAVIDRMAKLVPDADRLTIAGQATTCSTAIPQSSTAVCCGSSGCMA
jgi:hypothetical protein